MNWYLDVFAEDEMDDNTLANLQACERLERANERSGPCEDDEEIMVPTIGMLPEESDHEQGSPLDLRHKATPGHHVPQGWNIYGF